MEITKAKIWKKIEDYIETHHMLDGVQNIVAGVSGGPDSMCMLHSLWLLREKYGYVLQVVHIHHGIRGKDADEDMEHVEMYCKLWNLPFRAFRYDVPQMAKSQHLSDEEMGRKLRYETFAQVLEELGGGKIAVAHNSDDSSETFLLNLFRGTGIKGLSGIQPVRGEVIRPVLSLTREEIMEYLKENRIDYRIDASNLGVDYTRNKIRNHLIPYVQEKINEKASEHIRQASENLHEISCYMERQADSVFASTVSATENRCEIALEAFRKEDRILQKMVIRKVLEHLAGKLKDISAVHIALVLDLMNGDTGRQMQLPYQIVCRKNYEKMEFSVQAQEKTGNNGRISVECTLDEEGKIDSEIFINTNDKMCLELLANTEKIHKIEEKMYTKWMDYDILKGSLQIRNRENGDYIVINRQGGKKKIKDYFIDLKIPREKRDQILLLAKGQEVFWIIGYRISERCKVTEQTSRVLKLEYCPCSELQ